MMLDQSLITRALPPGSMRYFAWLYTPAAYRQVIAALFVIEAELHDSARAAHEVAHHRLQWWRDTIDRFGAGNSSGNPIADALADAVADELLLALADDDAVADDDALADDVAAHPKALGVLLGHQLAAHADGNQSLVDGDVQIVAAEGVDAAGGNAAEPAHGPRPEIAGFLVDRE